MVVKRLIADIRTVVYFPPIPVLSILPPAGRLTLIKTNATSRRSNVDVLSLTTITAYTISQGG